jgi:hypothetical protein
MGQGSNGIMPVDLDWKWVRGNEKTHGYFQTGSLEHSVVAAFAWL